MKVRVNKRLYRHSMVFGLHLSLLAMGTFPLTAAAGINTNQEISQIYANYFLKMGQVQDALDVLIAQVQEDPSDVASERYLGLVALEKMKLDLAEQAFTRLIKKTQGTDQKVAGYYLAQAWALQGKRAKATHLLQSVKGEAAIRDSVEAALLALVSGERRFPPLAILPSPVWSGALELLAGYDSNVLLVSDANLATATDTETASPMGTLGGRVNRLSARSSNQDLNLGVIASFTGYSVKDAQIFNMITASTLAEVQPSQALIDSGQLGQGLGLDASGIYLNTNGYQFFSATGSIRYRGVVRVNSRIRFDWELAGRYQKFSTETLSSPELDDRSGPAIRPRFSTQWRLGAGILTFAFQYDQAFATGKNFQSRTWTVPLSYQVPQFIGRLGLNMSVDYNQIQYPENTLGRDDKNFGGTFATGLPLGKKWLTSAVYSYRKNLSTVDSAQYGKHTAVMGVSYVLH